MDFKKKSESFKKRFGILDTYDEVEEFNRFKSRILNIFESIDWHVSEKDIVKFCTWFGVRVKKYNGQISSGSNIFNLLENETNEKQLFFLIEKIFLLSIEIAYDRSANVTYSKSILYRDLKEAIEISEINLSITQIDNEVILFPRGEEVLDKGLVEEVFTFLNSSTQQHFVSALHFYNERNKKSSIKSAESIRRGIEEFLRFKLSNQQGLAANILELLKRLKIDQITSEIRNIISQIFSYLDKYFNDNSKHNDGDIGEAENEFLLYQSGLLMRYIDKIIPTALST